MDLIYKFVEKPVYENSGLSMLFRVKKNQCKMLSDRGFKDATEEYEKISKMTIMEFKEMLLQKSQNSSIASVLSREYVKEDDRVLVYYSQIMDGQKMTGKQVIAEIVRSFDEDIKHFIVISNNPLSSEAKSAIDSLRPMKNFEFFLYSQLVYNPTEHYLTPKHTLLKYEEAKKVLEENRLIFSQLPVISSEDPIARWYGAKSGDVMRIERKILLAESMVQNMIVYRAVRNIPLK